MVGDCELAIESPPLTIKDEMQEMFVWLLFSQRIAKKLVDDQEIDSPNTLASISNNDIVTICDIIRRHGGFISGKTLDTGDQIYVLVTKNLKFPPFMFNIMECCSKLYDIHHVTSRKVL